ncbi:MAG TPA: hypothetical protein VF768_11740 [Holophagaceae bacterium]
MARGTAKKAVETALAKDREGKTDQIMAFKSFLGSLEDLAGRDASALGNQEQTRVVFKLYRLEDNGGPTPTGTFQTQVTFSAAEALAMGDPDFEGRALAWAVKSGRFGKFQWRIMGWAAGEQTLDTTKSVKVEPPPGYEAPRAQEIAQAEPPRDPMANLKESLSVVALVKDALGGGAGKVDVEGIRAAARAEAFREADKDHREELRKLEDRWEARLEAAKNEAYTRGKADGRRETEDEWRPKLWDLERRTQADREPSILEEATKMLGGPEAVQGLVKAVISGMNRPAPMPQRVVQVQAPPHAAPGPVSVAPPPAPAVPVLPEPSRVEWRGAMEQTEEALDVLAENGSGAKSEELKRHFEAFIRMGEGGGTLGPWWQVWQTQIGPAVGEILAAMEPEPEGEEMDLEGFKAMLAQWLDEGAEDGAILAELDARTTVEQREKWRGFLRWMPVDVAAGMLGEDRHRARLIPLVEAFQAGK